MHGLGYVFIRGAPLLRAVSGCAVLIGVLAPRCSVQVHNDIQVVLPVCGHNLIKEQMRKFGRYMCAPCSTEIRRDVHDTYSAQRNALSRAWRDPPTKGRGGCGSLAIHHPTGILTAVSPLDAMKLKSLSVMNVRQ